MDDKRKLEYYHVEVEAQTESWILKEITTMKAKTIICEEILSKRCGTPKVMEDYIKERRM